MRPSSSKTPIPETAIGTLSNSRQSPLRLRALLFLLCAALGASGFVFFQRHRQEQPPTPAQRLHGNSEEAASALADMQAEMPLGTREAQLLRLSRDSHPGTRYAAIDALGNEKGRAATDTVEGAFTDSSAEVRERALEVLSQLSQERGQRLLLRGLRDEDTWIRRAAASQLKLSPDTRAIPALLAALDDPDPAVANLAMGALRRKTKEPFYASVLASPIQKRAAVAQWRQWWQDAGQSRFPAARAPAFVEPLRPQRADPAPDFSLTDLDGKPVRLSDQRGRVTLLNFWGSWCPPCQGEIPDLVRLDANYGEKGLDIIGIALNENSAAALRAWCAAHGVAYRQTLATEAVQQDYGNIEEVPVSVLIDRHGRIRYRWEGERDLATFQAAVTRLLQEPAGE